MYLANTRLCFWGDEAYSRLVTCGTRSLDHWCFERGVGIIGCCGLATYSLVEHPCKDTRLYVAKPQHANLKHSRGPLFEHTPCKDTRLYIAKPQHANLKHSRGPPFEHPPCKGTRLYAANLTARQTTWNTAPAQALSTHARVLGCMLPTYSTPNHLKHSTSPSSEHPCKDTRLYVAKPQHANLKHSGGPPFEHTPCKDTRLYIASLQHANLKHSRGPPFEHTPCKDTRLYIANLQHANLKHNTSPRSEHPPCKGTRLYAANLQHAKPPETQHRPKLWAPMQGY